MAFMKAGLQVMKNPQLILLKQEIKYLKCVCFVTQKHFRKLFFTIKV